MLDTLVWLADLMPIPDGRELFRAGICTARLSMEGSCTRAVSLSEKSECEPSSAPERPEDSSSEDRRRPPGVNLGSGVVRGSGELDRKRSESARAGTRVATEGPDSLGLARSISSSSSSMRASLRMS